MASRNSNVTPMRPGTRARRGRPSTLPDLTALGTTGLRIAGGYVFEEMARELVGQRGALIYREMRDDDPIIGAVLNAIEWLCKQVSMHVEMRKDRHGKPFGDAKEQEENVEFVQSCFDDMSVSWHDQIGEILTCLTYGWSYMEICYKVRAGERRSGLSSTFNDGRIGWDKFALRGQDTLLRWEWDPAAGFIKGMHQIDTWQAKQAYIPIEKALLFRPSSNKQNPEGRSLLRSAFRAWYYKKHLQAIEAIGIERDMAGLPYAEIPVEYFHPQADVNQKQVLQHFIDLVTGIRNDEQSGVVIPLAYDGNGNKLFNMGLMSTGGARQIKIDETVNRYNRDIAAAVALADFMLLGHENQGSFALADDKTSMFMIALGAILDMICDVINRFGIKRLLRLNGRDTASAPVMVHGDIQDVSLDMLSTFVQKLALAGVPFLEGDNAGKVTAALMARAKLPSPDPEDIEDVPATRPGDEQGNGTSGINQSGQVGTGGAKQKGKRKPAPDQKGTSGGSRPKPAAKAATEDDDA